MPLPKEQKEKLASLVKRETVLLPEMEYEVVVRGLMAGEVQRAGESKRSADVQVALSTEFADGHPQAGAPIWNPNDRNDLDEIATLPTVDLATILEASNRLSGMDKLGKMFSRLSGNGSSALPEFSDAPSGS